MAKFYTIFLLASIFPSDYCAVPSWTPNWAQNVAQKQQNKKVDKEKCWKESKDPFGTTKEGGYTIGNNLWGNQGDPSSQNIWACNHNYWGFHSRQSNTDKTKVQSYPYVERRVDKKLSQLKSLTSAFSAKNPSPVPEGSIYDMAYDIWDDKEQYEIMLWFDWTSKAGPIAESYDSNGAKPVEDNVRRGGYTWTVYKGSNGKNAVFSFLIKKKTTTAKVDILDIFKYIKEKGWFGQGQQGDIILGKVQFGWEVVSTPPKGLDFECEKFRVDYTEKKK